MAFGASESDFVIKVGSRAFVNNLIAELGNLTTRQKKLFALLDRRDKMPPRTFCTRSASIGVPRACSKPEEPPEDIADAGRV
jgi:ATP phosphoribosyltransferase regulatory subunit HisZ